eukprot:gene7691-7752_t
MRLLSNLLDRFIRNGQLTLIDYQNQSQRFGSGQNGPSVTVRLRDAKIERELFLNPELKAAEAYMDGRLTIENGGTAYDLINLFSCNRTGLAAHPLQRVLRKVWYHLRRLHQAGKQNYEAIRPQAVAMMGERFCRMWDFYLASVELGFLNGSNFVFQLMLSSERDAVPVTRDFITDESRRLADVSAR